jgi:serine/threonine-protein kinase HipA
MIRSGNVYVDEQKAGTIWQDDDGYHFLYDNAYLALHGAQPVSFTLPLRPQAFTNAVLHPFFDGLIPEGWLLDITVKNWKLNPNDRMGLLLTVCRDCIGAVSVRANAED